jgi:hypothetical protein
LVVTVSTPVAGSKAATVPMGFLPPGLVEEVFLPGVAAAEAIADATRLAARRVRIREAILKRIHPSIRRLGYLSAQAPGFASPPRDGFALVVEAYASSRCIGRTGLVL